LSFAAWARIARPLRPAPLRRQLRANKFSSLRTTFNKARRSRQAIWLSPSFQHHRSRRPSSGSIKILRRRRNMSAR